MKIEAKSPEEYVQNISADRKELFASLRKTILKNLPQGFEETMSYGMIGYVVPHSIFPDGYHCNPKLPLPFMSIASQKNFIAFYHMGLYANKTLLDWFVNKYPNHSKYKLDMGKSCVRFKKVDAVPLKLIAELVKKVSVDEWIAQYQSQIK